MKTKSAPVSDKENLSCPFPVSDSMPLMHFTGRHHTYTEADTWYLSWGADDRMFSPYTDGTVNGRVVYSFTKEEQLAQVGCAIVEGNTPDRLVVGNEGSFIVTDSPAYAGRYPCACLHHNGIWYIGTYALAHALDYTGYNWPILGPFCGFHISRDDGTTWIPSPWNAVIGQTMFGEPAAEHGPVKLGALHVVDFGRNMEHSPDGKIYLAGHGTRVADGVRRKAGCSWITGDEIYLCRVAADPDAVNNPAAYEFFAGHDVGGAARWSPDFHEIRPVIEWPGRMGSAAITYFPARRKYLMAVTDGRETVGNMDSYVLEADELAGPWHMVWHGQDFGPQAYFLNFPSRFLAADGESGWLCLSANFTHSEKRLDPAGGSPPGCCYRLALLEVVFTPAPV